MKIKLKKETNKNKLKSIKDRLFFTVTFSSAVIIFTLVFLNSIVLKSFYLYSKINNLKTVYNEINEKYNGNIIPNEILSRIASKNNLDMAIENENGILEFSNNGEFSNSIN